MFKVDPENKIIYITRGDTASIIFSAKDSEGNEFHPTANDRLIFSAAKKVGLDPLIVITNQMNEDEEEFWTVQLKPEHTESLPFAKYAYDVQLEMRNSSTGELEAVNTIIGKTDEISPYLVIWGEVSQESE